MRTERTTPLTATSRGNVCVADGYGISINVHHGQLIVRDGVGRQRRERAFPRVRPGINRLVVIGRAGTISLEAVRWLTDLGIGYILRVPETQFGLSERASAGSSGAHLMLLLAI